MLDQVKNVLINDDIQKKLNDLQDYFKKEDGITYSEAAVFRRSVCALHKSIFKAPAQADVYKNNNIKQ